MKSSFFRHLIALALGFALVASASAGQTTTKYEPTSKVGTTALTMVGSGTRYRAVFKVYDMAIYATRAVDTPQELHALPGPKRMDFTTLRELSSTDIGLAFVKGLRANATPEQTARHLAATSRFIDVFSSRAKLMPGDTFGMQFVPGKGTTFIVAGEPQGAPVGDAEFFNMVLNIWIGSSPADPLLKDALFTR